MVLKTTGQDGALGDAHRRGIAALLSAAAEEILATPEFSRAPVMSRLLRYLVDRTASGDADRLKAYSVAIDALERPDDFDAQHDSYVRVQMARLRKGLARHYAAHTPRDGQCLYLQPGSFRVRIARPEVAYPEIFRPSVAVSATPEPVVEVVTPTPPKHARGIPMAAAIVAVAVLLAVLLAAVFVDRSGRGNASAAAGVPVSPILDARFEVAPEAGTLGSAVRDAMTDAIRRSWVLRLRTGQSVPGSERAAYALLGKVGSGPDGGRTLAVEVTETATGTLMWSRSIDLPKDVNGIGDAIAPLVTRIAGSTGLIATAEARRLHDVDAPGYACMLKYLEFSQTREALLQRRLENCLPQRPPESRMTAPLLAARSFFTLEAVRLKVQTPDAIQARARQAALFAQQAIEADPESAEAHYAFARIAYSRNDCVAGNRATQKAVESDPYQPLIGGVLAGLSYSCGYPDARRMLDRAIATQDEGDLYLRGYLLFAAIAQGRLDDVKTLGLPERPPPGPLLTRYLLLESIVAAAQDRRADAVKHWREFKQVYSGSRTSDEETLRHIVLSPRSRAQLLTLFRNKGVIPAG